MQPPPICILPAVARGRLPTPLHASETFRFFPFHFKIVLFHWLPQHTTDRQGGGWEHLPSHSQPAPRPITSHAFQHRPYISQTRRLASRRTHKKREIKHQLGRFWNEWLILMGFRLHGGLRWKLDRKKWKKREICVDTSSIYELMLSQRSLKCVFQKVINDFTMEVHLHGLIHVLNDVNGFLYGLLLCT